MAALPWQPVLHKREMRMEKASPCDWRISTYMHVKCETCIYQEVSTWFLLRGPWQRVISMGCNYNVSL